jgi:hypothetical protein
MAQVVVPQRKKGFFFMTLGNNLRCFYKTIIPCCSCRPIEPEGSVTLEVSQVVLTH